MYYLQLLLLAFVCAVAVAVIRLLRRQHRELTALSLQIQAIRSELQQMTEDNSLNSSTVSGRIWNLYRSTNEIRQVTSELLLLSRDTAGKKAPADSNRNSTAKYAKTARQRTTKPETCRRKATRKP